MKPEGFFSTADRDAIRHAASAAEGHSSGEVVPLVLGHCGPGGSMVWAAATWGALLASGLAAVVHHRWPPAGGLSSIWLLLPPFAGALLGAGLLRLRPDWGRLLMSDEALEARVQLRAKAAFLEEGVFKTRDRTGILIMLALREHRACILADEGINSRVAPAEWQGIVDALTRGIHDGRPAAALVTAIEACGRLLRERKVPRADDDPNELSDELRLRDA